MSYVDEVLERVVAKNPAEPEFHQAVKEVLERCDIPYVIRKDMLNGLWFKYMCNVGENLTCALLGIPFGAYVKSKEASAIRVEAMEEVRAVAKAKGIIITQEQLDDQYETIKRIPPQNKPSTLQDIEAGKKTEIEMFAGEMVRMGEELGVATPICRLFLNGIKVLEQKNDGLFQF